MFEHAGVLLYEGFQPLDAVGPFDALSVGATRDSSPGFEVSLVTVEPTDRVTSDYGVTVEPHGTVDGADPPVDLLVVPGGGWNDRGDRGARAEAERGVVPELLAEQAAAGVTVAGVCTGGMLMERAGLLDGRPGVTHPGAMDDLRATDAEVVDARVVDDGDLLTCGGVTSGIDLALHILEREFGADLAAEVAGVLEHEPRGPVHRSA